jgi:molybdate-binding protein
MTINVPTSGGELPQKPDLLMVAGSDDILFDRAMSLYIRLNPDQVVLFGLLGSLGGLRALRRGMCHIATSHLAEEDGQEFNFSYAANELEVLPAVVNFCRREQGLLVAQGNPLGIEGVADIGSRNLTVVNRPLGTSTRLLFDRELQNAEIKPSRVRGYTNEVSHHLDVGLEILSGRADIGLSIRPAAELLNLHFIPLRWERFDLLIPKELFFEKGIQQFLGLFHEERFRALADALPGYDLSLTGRMLYPGDSR